MEFVLAIDQGTSSTKVILFDTDGNIRIRKQREIDLLHPAQYYAEQDANQMIANLGALMDEVAAEMHDGKIPIDAVKCIGIANQRESSIAWCAETGQPLHNCITWLDERDCLGSSKRLEVDFSSLRNLSTEQNFFTDITNASRTMLMNLHNGEWDTCCCNAFGINRAFLPHIRPNSFEYGTMRRGPFQGIPITGMIGDQQASLLAQSRGALGSIKCTYGTGCFILANVDSIERNFPDSTVFYTVAFQIEGIRPQYAIESYIKAGGRIFQWMVKELGLAKSYAELDAIAARQTLNKTLVYNPPSQASPGSIEGISLATTKGELVRSTYQGVFNNIAAKLRSVQEWLQVPYSKVLVDGGLCRSDFSMQLQANLSGQSIKRFVSLEATALGAALCAWKGYQPESNIDKNFLFQQAKYETFLPK